MANKIHSTKLQDKTERNVFLMIGMLMVLLSVGGIVEIVPLFYLKDTMEHNKYPEVLWDRQDGETLEEWQAGDGVRPYTAPELMGRMVFIREGCYLCHSQMIRPFRDEKERYGHYSLASESMYDHPFQWGSKRTGPDLARVGAKYSNEWHYRHLRAPRDVVPESVMPNYPWLEKTLLDPKETVATMEAMRMLNVPYTDADIAAAPEQVKGINELQALVDYLQVLGTMVKLDDNKAYRE